MDLTISTPAIFFPAISLLLLAYTNRFLALSQLIRSLHNDYQKNQSERTLQQINHLRRRVFLIRLMQAFGAGAIFFCTTSIFALILEFNIIGLCLFIMSTITFLASIISSFIEILMSSNALNILLEDIEDTQTFNKK